MTSYEMVELGSRKKESRVNKPSLFKRKLAWPAKKMMRSLPFKVLLISFGILSYWGDVGLDGEGAAQWFSMRGCYRTINITLTDLPTSKLVTTDGKPAGLRSLQKYMNAQSVRSQWRESFLGKIFDYTTDRFEDTSGFYKNPHEENLFKRQMSDIMKDTMADVSINSIMQCRINNQNLTVRNVLTNFCPHALESDRGIRHILDKMEFKSDPGLLLRTLLLYVWKGETPILPLLKLAKRRRNSGVNITVQEMKRLLDNGAAIKNFLKTCGTHTTVVNCKDTSKDFCENGAPYFGFVILLAMLLPGLAQGLGNIIFYRAIQFPLGFGLEYKPVFSRRSYVAWPMRILAAVMYLVYRMLVGPFIPMYSAYLLFTKYIAEWKSGVVVDDNAESRIDAAFLALQNERSTEGLSESVVQFTVQLTFFSFCIWLVHNNHYLEAFLSLGRAGQTDFLDVWVPRTLTKCTISLLSFSMGVVSIMKMDKLFRRRAVRTSFGQNIREIFLTVFFSFVMLFVPICLFAILILLSSIAIFSWSYTQKSIQAHHYLFLLAYLPLLQVFLVQFLLYQKYVKPSTPRDQWFAFLSMLIPLRIYLIEDKRQAFIYHVSSTINSCSCILLSSLLLLIAIFYQPDEEDPNNGFFIFMLELPVPLILYFVLAVLVASLLHWYMVISPNFSTPHFTPDYEMLEVRLASFPSFWSYGFCNLVLKEKLRTSPTYSEESLEISPREWAFLEQVVESHTDKTSPVKDEHIQRKKTLEDILELEDLTPQMKFSLLDKTEEETQVKKQLLMNLGHTRAMICTRDHFSSLHFAEAGFFYSHPRLTGLQVTCFSCGIVLGPQDCVTPGFPNHHLSSCNRELADAGPIQQSATFLPLRLLPLGLAQSFILLLAGFIFFVEMKSKAQCVQTFLIILSGINISIVSTVYNNGPALSNLIKGIINYLFPLFLPGSPIQILFFHIFLNSMTNLSVILITTFYLGRIPDKPEGSLSSNHWIAIGLNLLIVIFSCLATLIIRMRRLMKMINLLMGG